MNLLVGSVKSEREAVELARAGATCVAVSLSSLPRFDVGTALSLEKSVRVRSSVRHCEFGVVLGGGETRAFCEHAWSLLTPDWVIVDARFLTVDLSEYLSTLPARIALYGVSIDYDDDPGWLVATMEETEARCRVDHWIVTVLPSAANPCAWLANQAGTYVDDLSAAELESILRRERVVANCYRAA